MVPYHRPKSGHITCYLNRTYHVLLTVQLNAACLGVQLVLPCPVRGGQIGLRGLNAAPQQKTRRW
jgi:hypothetical protein